MTLFTLAVKNVRHEARRYSAFFLSAAFSVWMFFLYASLLAHPEMSPDRVASSARFGLEVVLWVVAVFAVLFILYAQSSFFRVRQKELAVYSLLGMLPGQIGRMIHYESLVVGAAATAFGIGVGTVSLKLFFLAVAWVIGLPAPLGFHFSLPATLRTVLLFLAVFTVIALWSYFRVRRLPVAELVRSAARPKDPPGFAWWKVALAALSLGGAYWLALTATQATIESRFPYIAALLLVGTALLFTQGSVALLQVLRRSPLYWRRTNGLTISQLVYKMRDNARVLFMVCILTTFVLIAGGVYAAFMVATADYVEERAPIHLVLTDVVGTVDRERVLQVLDAHGTPAVAQADLPLLVQMEVAWREEDGTHTLSGVSVTPVSAFNRWVASLHQMEPLALEPEDVALLASSRSHPGSRRVAIGLTPGGPRAQAGAEAMEVLAEVDLIPFGKGVEPNRLLVGGRYSYWLLVMDDASFARLQERLDPRRMRVLHGFMVADWRDLGPAVRQLEQEMIASAPERASMVRGKTWGSPLNGTWSWYESGRRESVMFLFLLGFIALLFFLAAGNMLYFKLLNDLQDDRRQFQALFKVGVRPDEVGRILSTQALVLFFLPLTVATVHAGVALEAFVRLLGIPSTAWGALGAVVGLYLLLQGAYFLVARRSYVRAVLRQP